MKTKVENLSGCSRIIKIEASREELSQNFDQVYTEIQKTARIPGFRLGKAPRDLLQTYYGKRAEEEVVKQAVAEYYLKAVRQENLIPVGPPEIENVQLEDHSLHFSARVDVTPQVKIKAYRNLRITKKKINIAKNQLEQVLERLRQSKAKKLAGSNKEEKEKALPKLDDQFAKDFGFNSLQQLKDAISKDLQLNAEKEMDSDMEEQLIEQLLKRAALDVPESLVKRQTQELMNQLKLNRTLQGEKDIQSKEKELQDQARKEAIRRVKLAFILDKIAQLENIQVEEKDLDGKIAEISQRVAKTKDDVRQYLDKQNLVSGLKAEMRDKKTMEFLLREAKIGEQ